MTTAYWADFWGASWRRSNAYGEPGPRSLYAKGYHRGEDVANDGDVADVPVLRAGEIIDSGRSGLIGHWVCVLPDEALNRRDIYCHLFEPTSRESGRVAAGDIIARTAGMRESPGAVSGPHLHFVISDRSDGGFNTDRADYDPRPVIAAALARGVTLEPHQRRVVETDELRGRAAPTTQSAVVGENLVRGDVGNFVGWRRGELVDGDDRWAQGTSERWFALRYLEPRTTDGLTDLNVVALHPRQRMVRTEAVRERTGPTTDATATREFPRGDILDFDAWTRGQQVTVDGVTSDTWFRGEYAKLWFSAACFTSQDTAGLLEVTAPAAPAGTLVKTYPGSARVVESPNSEPRRAGAVIRYVILHLTANAVDHTAYYSRRNERQTAPHLYPRPDGQVTEFVRLGKRAWTTGVPLDHEAVTFEIEALTDATAAQYEAVAVFLAWLSQQTMVDGIPVDFQLDRGHVLGHREVPGVTSGTSCPGELNIDRIITRARVLLAAEHPQKPDAVTVDRSRLQALLDWLKQLLGGDA